MRETGFEASAHDVSVEDGEEGWTAFVGRA